MKSFLTFLSEATASQQAARLGLVGDGHGGWYDKKTGEFTAKTEKGRLKFYNKRQKVGSQDPPQSDTGSEAVDRPPSYAKQLTLTMECAFAQKLACS